MNKLAEKIVAAMNADELEALIDDHYLGESQTLTTGAEENLLKLGEMRGRLTAEQTARWEAIKKGFVRVQRMGGDGDDPASRLTGQLSLVSEHLDSIGDSIDRAVTEAASAPKPSFDPDLTVPDRPGRSRQCRRPARPRPVHRKAPRASRGVSERPKAGPPPRLRRNRPPADYELISREAYLIRGHADPADAVHGASLPRVSHAWKIPRSKQLITKLEYVDDIERARRRAREHQRVDART